MVIVLLGNEFKKEGKSPETADGERSDNMGEKKAALSTRGVVKKAEEEAFQALE